MKREKYTDEEIDAILNSADGISRAEVSPFFYTRLESKLEQMVQPPQPPPFIKLLLVFTQPALAISILSIFLVMNIFAIKGMMSSESKQSGKTSELANFAIEYNLNSTTVYTKGNN